MKRERATHQRFVADFENPNLHVGREAFVPGKGHRLSWWRRILRSFINWF